MTVKGALLSLVAIAPALSWGANEGCSYETKPKFITRPGRSPVIDYTCEAGKTRIAKFEFKTTDVRRFTIPLQITETECGTARPLCHAEFDLRAILGTAVWEQNPDPEKIGRQVKLGSSEFPLNAEVHDLVPAQSGKFFEKLGPTKIVCDDWSWLPPAAVAAKKWNAYRWEVELNVTNPETGRSENMSFGSVQDAVFEIDGRESTATSRGAVNLSIGFRLPFVFGVNFLFLPDGVGGVCQVTAQAGDTTRLANELRALHATAVSSPELNEDDFAKYRDVVGDNFEILLLNAAAFYE